MSLNHQIHSPSGESTPSVVPFGRSVTWRWEPVSLSHAYNSYVPVAFDTNRERCGASSAQSGSDTRGALNRFSQSGMASVPVAFSAPVSLMPPYCLPPPTIRWRGSPACG
ncbi:hypothetical protein SALBM135S_06286 [Streptomyces alboniger]